MPVTRAKLPTYYERARGGQQHEHRYWIWGQTSRDPLNHTRDSLIMWTTCYSMWTTLTPIRCPDAVCPQSTGPTTTNSLEKSPHEEKSQL